MIKLMHLVHKLNTGGSETLVKNYMLNFNKDCFDGVLLCVEHDEGSPYEEELKKAGIRVIYVQDYLPFKNQINIFKKTINYFCRYLIIRKIIREESPDIIHTHLPINTFVKFARPKKNTVIFHTVHTKPMALWSRSDKKNQRDFRAVKWLIKNYGMKMIVLHSEMQREIKKLFGVSDSIIINNGVDSERIKNVKNSKDVRANIGILKNAFVLGHVGRFSTVKNQEFLTDIFMEVQKKKKNAFLLMVGDGLNKNRIIEKLNKNGLVGKYLILSNRDDVADLLNAMDVFVFPSLYEGLPLSLIEAQIARKPCFASDTVNEYATISNLVSRLSLNDSVEKWADVILSYEKPKKIIVNDDDWDIKKITEQLEQLYLDTLAEKDNGKK